VPVFANPFALTRTLAIGAGLAVSLSLSACGSEAPAKEADPVRVAGFPLTIDNCGRQITIDSPPRRTVSLNQGSTEILLSLGLADRMVGTAGWTDPVLESLDAANASVPRLADQAPSYERVLDADPDLVTASFANTFGEGGVTTPEALSKLGVGAYLSPAECLKNNDGDGDGERESALEIDAIFQEITELSQIFGVPERGEQLVADLRARLAAAEAGAKDSGLSVLYWFANAESPYIAGCCGGPGIISRALDITNSFDDTTEEWPQINWETVADRNPDVLVLGDLTRKSQTAETAAAKIRYLRTNPVTAQMDAVKNERFVLLTGAELNPSIRTVYAVENVATQLAELGLTEPGSGR
jgi:iron complex transport system substrate-binding protein